jgi:fumarate reductase flavoprotein subunit
MQEQARGGVFEGPYGTYVHLDIRHLGEKKINQKIPFVRELTKNYVGIDPVHQPIPVRPVVHYMMGGIDTNTDAATSLPGLYAAGECACVSINGSNRLGSNSLVEILVFGARAGHNAAQWAREHPDFSLVSLEKQAESEQARIAREFINKHDGEESLAGIRTELQHTMEAGCGIYRTDATLRETVAKLAELRERYARVRLDDHSVSFNTELTAAIELDIMIDLAQAIAQSALRRTESRGSHQRSDFPERDDTAFLKHSLAYRTDGEPRIEYRDVTITNWPPGERVYGRAH